ncbi:MAG: hypothetical protein ACM3PF_07275, partial [Bacteroidota bacterium]
DVAPHAAAPARAESAPSPADPAPIAASEPPSQPSPVAEAPAAEGSEAWKRIVDRVKERKLLLGTCLEEGVFLGLAGTAVRVALAPEHTFHKAMLEMKENREILNQEFEKQFGRGAALACVVGHANAATAATERVRAELQADGLSATEAAEAATAPEAPPGAPPQRTERAEPTIVQRIVEIFDGEILDWSGETGAPGNGVA